MKRNPIETVLGAVVLLIAGMFLAFAYSTADVQAITGYSISANFLKVGGLQTGSDVRISGIRIGTVTKQGLDPQTFQATVTMSISGAVKLPQDTEAAIVSDGLLGGKYINLIPGKGPQTLADGGKITKTRDFQSVEDLVGEIIFLATQKPEEKAAAPEAPQ
jgi:phospholipid/cholesterol/gamma-HCH transport system substrate-binding protein